MKNRRNYSLVAIIVLFTVVQVYAQQKPEANTFWEPVPRNYEVKQAIEVESLVPMFFLGGFISIRKVELGK